MKPQYLKLLIASLLCLLAGGLATASGNLLQNPGFEEGMSGWDAFGKGWRFSAWRNEKVSDAHAGNNGMVDDVALGDTNEEWRAVSQTIPAKTASIYTARAWIRTFNVDLSASYVEVQFLGGQTNLLKQFQSKLVAGDQPFRLVAVEGMESPREAVWAVMRGVVHVMPGPREGVGFHIFDDFEFDTVQQMNQPPGPGRDRRSGE